MVYNLMTKGELKSGVVGGGGNFVQIVVMCRPAFRNAILWLAILGELCGGICKLAGANKKHVSVKYNGRNFERKRRREQKEGGIRNI